MTFYTVFSPSGEAPAKVQHATHGEALFAARRMATAHPEQEFFVMKSASKAQVKPKVHDTIGDSDGSDGA